MRKTFLFLILGLVLISTSFAQKIRITRTDVEPVRFGFVTATLKFGFDIYIDDIQDAKGVTFTLEHTKQDVIQFSGFTNGDFPEKGTIVTNTPFPTRASLSVAALSGLQTTDPGVDTPFAVHLEFVVTPTAKHLENARFTFTNIRAIVGPDSLVIIPDSIIDLTINGFINVYPGDANFDGVVNSLDYAEIAFYTGAGSANSTVRGFKRKNASAIWNPQPALAWDSAQVTDVDCDGSGDINLSDMLVIATNIEKRHTDRTRRTILGLTQPVEKGKNTEEVFSQTNQTTELLIPQTIVPIIGILSKKQTLHSFENIKIDTPSESFIHNGKSQFFVGRTSDDMNQDFRSSLLKISSSEVISSIEATLIFENGMMEDVMLTPILTSVEPEQVMSAARTTESYLTIKHPPVDCYVTIYSLLGQQLYSQQFSNTSTNELLINYRSLTPVIIRVSSEKNQHVKSFLVP